MKRSLLMLAATTVLAVGCGDSGSSSGAAGAQLPDRAFDRHGTITQVAAAANAGTLGTVLVEEFPGVENGDKISLAITPTTVLVEVKADGTRVAVGFGALAKGREVQVWIDGAVAESYPEQGGASAVLVVG